MKQIRNFSIIAHIDHGKSTLADRFLEITGTVAKNKLKEQYLDKLDLERERGITIKLAPVTMEFKNPALPASRGEPSGRQNPESRIGMRSINNSEFYILNLIDTPGHADFSYEVSRSLAAVEGAILLVDATKGIEAQTLSNFLLATNQGLVIIPAVNKIDMPNAQTQLVKNQLQQSLGFRQEEILEVSAKEGTGVEELLNQVVKKIPEPRPEAAAFKSLIFDSLYDQFKGVVAFVRVFDGQLKKGDKIKLLGAHQEAVAESLGYFAPELKEKEALEAGEIGWVATGLKEVKSVQVGDTIGLQNEKINPLPGYKEIKPMVFAGIFPVDRDEFPKLRDALEKFRLNDASLVFEPENSPALGFGVRAGFLGMLHMEIVQERLEREYDLDLMVTTPTVPYLVFKTDGESVVVSNPQDLPLPNIIKQVREPWVSGSVVSTSQYLGPIQQLLYSKRALIKNVEYFGEKINISCELPLAEIVTDFYDKLKTVSSGFASFDYELSGYKEVAVAKLEISVAKEPVDALSQIVLKQRSYETGKSLVQKLKETIPRQQFEIALQAAIGGKIVASERIPPFRKDVTAKLYGGDRTRKDKLLGKQKAGKKRMKRVGKVDIPQEAFLSALKI